MSKSRRRITWFTGAIAGIMIGGMLLGLSFLVGALDWKIRYTPELNLSLRLGSLLALYTIGTLLVLALTPRRSRRR